MSNMLTDMLQTGCIGVDVCMVGECGRSMYRSICIHSWSTTL